jgi:hypothetical protein
MLEDNGTFKPLKASIDKILGTDITSAGSLTGFLEAVNVHKENKFFIYPPVGPKKVECVFKHDELFEKVREGIEKYVNVVGTLFYKSKGLHPYKIRVEKIEIYPPENKLPSLMSLRGIAPGLTGGKDSVAFVREQREAEE